MQEKTKKRKKKKKGKVCEAIQLLIFILFGVWSTYLSDQLELELDAMRCSISLSSSKCLPPFQVVHLMLYPPAKK